MLTALWKDYEVIACGDGEKLERWGNVYLLRPDPQVIWPAPFALSGYDKLNAHYRRDGGGGRWEYLKKNARRMDHRLGRRHVPYKAHGL